MGYLLLPVGILPSDINVLGNILHTHVPIEEREN
jgi:hypothetical protein